MSNVNVNYLEPLPVISTSKRHHSNHENILSSEGRQDLVESDSDVGGSVR
jgi:hypothetical protein